MNNESWKSLFRDNRHAQLAMTLRQEGRSRRVRCLADNQVQLLGGASGSARTSKRASRDDGILSVVVTPDPNVSEQEFAEWIEEARTTHPQALISGFGPSTDFNRTAYHIGEIGSEFLPSGVAVPQGALTAVLTYAPNVEPEALLQAVRQLESLQNVTSVVPLPLSAGDRIPIAGQTTSGSTDVMIMSVLRHYLPTSIRVRSSWAALGWKVAQLGVVYGADELAGWSEAESLVYTGRVRAAARVELEEVRLGVEEAGREFESWVLVEEVTH